MHAKTLVGLSLVVLAGAAGLSARASDGAAATDAKTYTNRDLAATATRAAAPVYTNADLEKFGPPAPATAPRRETARMDDAAAWAFVQAALDREAARLEGERRYALDLEASRFMGTDTDENCGRHGYITAPFLNGFGFDHRGRAHRGGLDDPHDNRPPLRRFLSRRETLHGRPTAEETGLGPAARLKGRDAFPDAPPQTHSGHSRHR